MHSFLPYIVFALTMHVQQAAVSQENAHVRFEIRLASVTLQPGTTGEIALTLTPNEGIHINTDPAPEFEFEKNSFVHPVGITSLPKNEKTGYLDATQPVKYSFALGKNVPNRKYVLKGTVRYFFCSDAEGWCNRFVQPFELRYTVTR